MSEAIVGQTTRREVYFAAVGTGVPLTGGTVTYTLRSPTGTTLLNAVSATEDSGGWYYYDVDGSSYLTTAGVYQEAWALASVDLPQQDTLLVRPTDSPLVTRRELRHGVARELNDLVLGQATSVSTTTLVDSSLAGYDDELRGQYVYIYAGTGRGQERRVTDYVASTGTLTVPTWTTTPDTSSRFEVHRWHRVEDYNDALNAAILECSDQALWPMTDESLTVSDDTVYEYSLPAGFRYLRRVWVRDRTDTTADWRELRRRDLAQPHGLPLWDVVPGRRLLRLTGPVEDWVLRLDGQMVADPLTRDTQYCDAPPAFVRQQAAGMLALRRVSGPQLDRDAWGQRAAVFFQRADRLKPRQRPYPGSVRV